MVILDSFPFQEDGSVQYLGGVRGSARVSANQQRPIHFGSADISLADSGNYSLNSIYESHECADSGGNSENVQFQGCVEGGENSQGYMKCRLCSYQTKIESLLRRHVIKHSLDSDFRCPACDFQENDAGKFVDHIGTHQSGKLVRCCFCPKKMSRGKLKSHIRIHRAVELYDCSMCQFSTNYEKNIKSHMDVYHTKEHSCTQCGQVMTKHDLHWHMKFVHSMEPTEMPEKIITLAAPAGLGVNTEILEIPSKNISSQSANIFSRKFTASGASRKTSLAIKKQKHFAIKKLFNCGKCEYKTPFKKLLRVHRAKHLLDNSLVCTKCGFSESGPGKFASHLSVHSPVDLFECCFCGFKTPTRGTMSNHVSKHKPVPMFDCSECEFSARRPASVRTHMRRRHGKRLQCKSCGLEMSRFALASHLRECQNFNAPDGGAPSLEIGHYETAPEPDTLPTNGSNIQPDDKTVTCELCDKPYSKSYLRKHVKKCILLHGPEQQRMRNEESEATLSQVQPVTSDLTNDGASAGISQVPSGANHEVLILKPKSPNKPKKLHLRCNSCPFKTRKKRLLKKHVVKHLIDYRLTCPVCGHKEMSSFRFAHHIMQHGPDSETFQCCFCSLSTPTSKRSYCAHLDLHRPVYIFDCQKCEYSSNRADCVRNHYKNNHSKNRKCQHCGESMSKSRLIKHSRECHGEVKDITFGVGKTDEAFTNEANLSHPIIPKQENVNLDKPGAQPSVECAADVVQGSADSQVVQAEKPSDIEMSLVEADQDFLKCTKCTYKTKIHKLMDRHIGKHLLDAPFVCPLCGFEHLSSRKFANHWDKHECNAKKKIYQCCFCDAEVKKKNCLKAFLPQHIEDHRHVALQDCSECEFSSHSRYELDKHYKNQHIKKCECLLCGEVMSIFEYASHTECKGGKVPENVLKSAESAKSVEQSVDFSTLRRQSAEVQDSLIAALEDPSSLLDVEPSDHVARSSKAAFPESGLSPVIKQMLHCSNCNYSTQYKSLLERHVLKHLIDIPFSCKHCLFTSFDERTFADHVFTHTGSYRCIFCHYHAGNYTVATRHYSSHKALATNDCPKCEFTSTYKYRLIEHLRGKHVDIPRCSYCCKKMLKEELVSHERECGRLFRSMSHSVSSGVIQMAKDGLKLDTSPRALVECYKHCWTVLKQRSGLDDRQPPPVTAQSYQRFDGSCHNGDILAQGSVQNVAKIQPGWAPVGAASVENSHSAGREVVAIIHELNAVTDFHGQKPELGSADPGCLELPSAVECEPTVNPEPHYPPIRLNQDPIHRGPDTSSCGNIVLAVMQAPSATAVDRLDSGLDPSVCMASSVANSSHSYDMPTLSQDVRPVVDLPSQSAEMEPSVCLDSLAEIRSHSYDFPTSLQESSSVAVTSSQDRGLELVSSAYSAAKSSYSYDVLTLSQDLGPVVDVPGQSLGIDSDICLAPVAAANPHADTTLIRKSGSTAITSTQGAGIISPLGLPSLAASSSENTGGVPSLIRNSSSAPRLSSQIPVFPSAIETSTHADDIPIVSQGSSSAAVRG